MHDVMSAPGMGPPREGGRVHREKDRVGAMQHPNRILWNAG
jgi:hypothetical protein